MRSGTTLKTVGLFAGVGGFEFGIAKAGHDITSLCEIDPAARAVLRKRFDGVGINEDIRLMSRLPRGTELVVAGFPCQDLSQVGQTRGMLGEKSGIVSHVFRLLEKIRAQWVLLENVPFMLRLDRGAAIRYVTSRLETLGYSWAYRTVDTRSFGLPQRRERVFLLAGLKEEPWKKLYNDGVSTLASPSADACPPQKRDPTFHLALGDLASSGRMWLVPAHPLVPFLPRRRHRREPVPSANSSLCFKNAR
jgi:DNA (cytosine-5)-methyltransferase 1